MTMTIAVIAGLLIMYVCLLKIAGRGRKKTRTGRAETKKPSERVLGRKIRVQVRSFNHTITNAGNKKPAESG